MNNRKERRGELTSSDRNKNYTRYASSAAREDAFFNIFIVLMILLLAILLVIFFAISSRRSSPAFSQVTTGSTQQTTGSNVPKPQTFPFATLATRDSYLSTGNGTGLGGAGLYSDYAILVDLSDMSAVARKGPDTPIYPASMTKVMTVVVACDLIHDLNDTYVLTSEVLNKMPVGASSAWLKDYAGQTVTVEDLLFGISYRSGADAVLCLLDYLGLSTEQFVALMNQKADEIGLESTHFGGAIGMDDENNSTTCREMAAIMAYAMENPLCRRLFGGGKHRLKYIEMTYYHATIVNTFSKLDVHTADGLVNGYTVLAAKSGREDNAGYCLVSYIENSKTGDRFVLVTAHAPTEDRDNTLPVKDIISVLNAIRP